MAMSTQPLSAKRRSAHKHRAILTAAADGVEQVGYGAVTVEGVAKRAGVGKQTIYRWWPSKAALMVELYTDIVSREALQVADEGSLQQRLTSLLRALFTLYRRSCAGAILTGLIGEASGDASVRALLREGLVAGREDIVTGLVAAANRRGESRADAGAVNEVIIALVWQRLVLQPDSLDDDFADHLTALALAAGVRATEEKGS